MQEKCTVAQQSCLSRSKAVLVQKEQRDQQFRKVGHGNDSHGSVRLPIGRLSVRSTATEWIAVTPDPELYYKKHSSRAESGAML